VRQNDQVMHPYPPVMLAHIGIPPYHLCTQGAEA